MSLQPSYATNRWPSSPFAVGMCVKQCRCSVFERLCQHPQQIDSKPSCAGGLQKASGSERAANEFDYAELVVPGKNVGWDGPATLPIFRWLDRIGLLHRNGPHMSEVKAIDAPHMPAIDYDKPTQTGGDWDC